MAAAASLEDVYLLRPLNQQPPTADDKRHSEELEEFLRSKDLVESLDEALLREEVLGLFYQLVQNWVKGICRRKNFSVEDARAHVYTFGSYRLGVHGPGADMDTLVVGPRYVSRETDFFGSDKHCLQYLLTQTPDVTDIQPVPDAFVPMIGIKYKGVQIDVLYASLAMHTLPEELDLSNHAVLRGCDEATVRALNGCRVTDTLLKMVPRQDVFRLALRAVKYWASQRGISSNVMGYLGGVNLAIMVAKICQLYPRAEASTILVKFFILMKEWPWPRAIHLRVPEEHSMGLPVWDPRPGTRDSQALMPVITPAYPAMNSLYNVRRSTLEVMMGEFAAASEVCTRFLAAAASHRTIDWAQLFTPVPFFAQHTFYIQLEVSADTEDDLVRWDGWVSSRIRRLVEALQDSVRVRPHPKPQRPPPPSPPPSDPDSASDPGPDADFKKGLSRGAVPPRLYYYLGLDKRLAPALTSQQLLPNGQVAQLGLHGGAAAASAAAGKVDLKQPCTGFVNEVSAWRDKRPGMELKVNVLRRAQLPDWLQPQQPLKQEAAGVEGAGAGAATPPLEGSVTPPPLPLADGPTATGVAVAGVAANGGMKRSASGAAAAAAGGGEGQAAKRARTDEAGDAAPAPAAVPAANGGMKRSASGPTAGTGGSSEQAAKRGRTDKQGVGAGPVAVRRTGQPKQNREPLAAAAAQPGEVGTDVSALASAAGEPQQQQEGLQLPASAADEKAAVLESQLHNTGRDMGDWLGADHGVSLAGQQGTSAEGA